MRRVHHHEPGDLHVPAIDMVIPEGKTVEVTDEQAEVLATNHLFHISDPEVESPVKPAEEV